MKPRARRVTLATAVLGVGVVGVLAVAHWGTVRDHVEAWRFQLRRETRTITPSSALKESALGFMLIVEGDDSRWHFDLHGCLLVLSTYSDLPVVFDSAEDEDIAFSVTSEDPSAWIVPSGHRLSAGEARVVLQANGWRVLEQRFPRKAYVVIHDEGATQ